MRSLRAFHAIGYCYILFFTLVCLFPVILVLSGSFTDESSIYRDGYQLIPKVFSTDAYSFLFRDSERIVNAYTVTIFVTFVGTVVGLFLTAMSAYVLLRKDFKYRNFFSFFFYFTTMFSGGLVPVYILMVRYLELKDTYLALILPLLISAFNIILMRNFMKTVPEAIIESAKIDGAGDFTIFIRLILPLSIPALATIGLFLAITYWNDWMLAMLYVESQEKYPLQFMLYEILRSAEYIRDLSYVSQGMTVPSESFKMATAVVVTGPIILAYPFVQKFFVKGLTIGAVKG